MTTGSLPIRRPRITPPAKISNTPRRRAPHVITVTSGKGGVGKTNLTANLGWHLRQLRRRVMILDADLGLANIDIILGLTPDFDLSHVLNGEKEIREILTRGPAGMLILPASSGVTSVTDLTESQKIFLLQQMETLQDEFDFLLIDTAAGLASNVIYFNLAAQTTIVIVTPEPTSLTDAYALIKVLSRDYHQKEFKILSNSVRSEDEGLEVFNKLTRVTDRFLNVSLDYLGFVIEDRRVTEAVRMQRPFCDVAPDGPASTCLRKIARQLVETENDLMNSDLGLLWRNLITPPQARAG